MKVMKFEALAWCMPCRAAVPIWTKFKSLHPEVEFQEVDVDSESELAKGYNVLSIPYFLSIDRAGLPIKTFIGVPKLEDLEALLV
jgi:thiol-disulfide isomerase/thioredoxin